MFDISAHETKINDLISNLKVDGVDQAKVSVLLQELRDNYNEVTDIHTKNSKQIESINGTNEGLRSANMQLLSKLGTQFKDIEKPDPKPDPKPAEEVLTPEDIIKNFR